MATRRRVACLLCNCECPLLATECVAKLGQWVPGRILGTCSIGALRKSLPSSSIRSKAQSTRRCRAVGLQNKSPSQSWVLARAKAHVTGTSKPRSHVPAQVPSDNNIQLVLSDWQARQTVIAVVAPSKPDERSVRRWPSGVVINTAVPAIELHDREVCARWSGSHKAERQCTNCEEDFLHSP
jgi:hypothetical protein